MYKIALVAVACLACICNGRRVLTSMERLQSSEFEDDKKADGGLRTPQSLVEVRQQNNQGNAEDAERDAESEGKGSGSEEDEKTERFKDRLRDVLAGKSDGSEGADGIGDDVEGSSEDEQENLKARILATARSIVASRSNSADGADSNSGGDGERREDDSEGPGNGESPEEEPERGQKISRMIIIEHVTGPDGGSSDMGQGIPGMGGGPKADEEDDELPALVKRLEEAQLPQEAKELVDREVKRLKIMPRSHPEYSKIVEYLEFVADLPWAKSSNDTLTISAARDQLESDHFGMERVKARILEYLSVAKLKGDLRGSILCLYGPPGIGKTSLGRSVADALNRDFYRVSLGGVHSESEVRGHRRTYVGAMPGLILQALKKCGTNNCVIMLDEIDKLGRHSTNGDPSSALLEVLDPEQNQNFRDHYLNLAFNLSKVLFIATANELEPIPRPLRDRMEIIEMSGYTVEEKVQIASRHLLPKQCKLHGLKKSDIQMEESAIDALISGYTRESGVRELGRQLAAICRSVAAKTAQRVEANAKERAEAAEDTAVEGSTGATDDTPASAASSDEDVDTEGDEPDAADTIKIDSLDDLIGILGPPKFDGPRDNLNRVSKPGIATGLAYTAVGGDVLYVEAETMKGRGALTITGSLGDVMAESVKIATGWVRAHADELGIPAGPSSAAASLLNGTDLHIHFPAGATPKDGPSAGVTIATAIVSLLTGRLVRPDLAMTGEITLRGMVLPVGGIKEKLIAAHRAGMKQILIPAKNEKDLRELPTSVLNEINVNLVKDIDDVLAAALQPLQNKADGKQRSRGWFGKRSKEGSES